jgi:hypothetical protein
MRSGRRFVGIDLGARALHVVTLTDDGAAPRLAVHDARVERPHHLLSCCQRTVRVVRQVRSECGRHLRGESERRGHAESGGLRGRHPGVYRYG